MDKTFILLTRLISEEVHPSFFIEEKARAVKDKIKEYCPGIVWIGNYAVVGPWDYIDIFQAPDMKTAMKVATLVRSYGGAHTEIWPALEWEDFRETMRVLEVA
jgi:uncharacterized protein with GYD domain